MSIGVIVASLSAVVSLIAVIVALKTARDQRKLSENLAREEHRLLFEQVRMARDTDVIRWSSNCLGVLSEIESEVAFSGTSNNNSCDYSGLRRLCHRLSALIDQGRMYFPNQAPEAKGGDKPPAYQGYRQIILTVLVRIYDDVSKFDAASPPAEQQKIRDRIAKYRRRYVSEAQLAIDPRRYIALKEMNDVKAEMGLQEQELGEVEGI